jgi:hypothetical protein
MIGCQRPNQTVEHVQAPKLAAKTKASRDIKRPGIPPATPLKPNEFPDKRSPPHRDDDQVRGIIPQPAKQEADALTTPIAVQDGHYVYELGENLSSRCKVNCCPTAGAPD